MTDQAPTTRIGTALFIVKPNGSFLMGHRLSKNGYGSWCIPGGHVEFGEDPKDTVCREALEECGIAVTSPHYVGYSSDVLPGNKHYVTLYFLSRVSEQAQAVCCEPEMIDQWTWVYGDEMPGPVFQPLKTFVDSLGPNGLRHLIATAPRAAA